MKRISPDASKHDYSGRMGSRRVVFVLQGLLFSMFQWID
jgi:hypothetical protein